MGKYGIHLTIGLIAFLIGTATVLAAPKIQSLVIGSPDGARQAEVSVDDRLLVDTVGEVTVSNLPSGLPDAANIVNLFVSVTDDPPGDCTNGGGLNYDVPAGYVFLLTDIQKEPNSDNNFVSIWTDGRGVLMELYFANNDPFSWRTPLLFHPGEIVCLSPNPPIEGVSRQGG